jgi:hypothetical protein
MVLRSCQAISALHPFQVEGLAKGDIRCSFSSGQVKSDLIGYDNSEDGCFEVARVAIVSSLAGKLVIRGFKDTIWNVLSTSSQVQWKVLEDYTLLSMTSEEQLNFDWKLNSSQRMQATKLMLGGCTDHFVVDNIIAAALSTPNVVFSPYSQRNKLVDFVYSKETNEGKMHVFYFQLTVGEVDCANLATIDEYRQQCLPHPLAFHYLVLPCNFEKFKVTYKRGQNVAHRYKETKNMIKIVQLAQLKEARVTSTRVELTDASSALALVQDPNDPVTHGHCAPESVDEDAQGGKRRRT